MTTTPLRQWVSTANANLKDKDDQDQVRFADLDLLKKINQVAIDAHTDIATLLGGVIIESGQNAYGFYQKFGDGTLIQHGWNWLLGSGAVNMTAKTITFPIPFVWGGAIPNVDVIVSKIGYKNTGDPTNRNDTTAIGTSSWDIWAASQLEASFGAYGVEPTGAPASFRFMFSYIATGRWK